jgi:hypothetical protein
LLLPCKRKLNAEMSSKVQFTISQKKQVSDCVG